MPKKKSSTRMQELADLAGVSRATVSRALSGSDLVNAETRERIRALAEQHNYRVNERARNLRLQRTGVISVVFMFDVKSEQHMSDPFFLEMLGGIADCLAEHDLDLYLVHGPVSNVLELENTRIIQNSDGVIFVGQGAQHRRLNQLAIGGTPMVVWGAPLPAQKYVRVGGDNVHGGYLAASHLIELGRREIAFFGDIELPEITLRHEGYLKALSEHGIKANPKLQIDVPFAMEHAREAIGELLDSNVAFNAAICTSDVMALSAITTIAEAGLRVPKDIAITGYDDIGLAQYSSPTLTTVRQNIPWAGRMLVESLLGILNGVSVADSTLSSELIVRQSSGDSLKNRR